MKVIVLFAALVAVVTSAGSCSHSYRLWISNDRLNLKPPYYGPDPTSGPVLFSRTPGAIVFILVMVGILLISLYLIGQKLHKALFKPPMKYPISQV